jgi:hypothetical protein
MSDIRQINLAPKGPSIKGINIFDYLHKIYKSTHYNPKLFLNAALNTLHIIRQLFVPDGLKI